MRGKVDEFRVYYRALTADEVEAVYAYRGGTQLDACGKCGGDGSTCKGDRRLLVDEVVSASGGAGTSGFGTAIAAAAMVLAFVGLVVGSIAGTRIIGAV